MMKIFFSPQKICFVALALMTLGSPFNQFQEVVQEADYNHISDYIPVIDSEKPPNKKSTIALSPFEEQLPAILTVIGS